MQVAVLALQGAFIEHEHALSDVGVESFEIREAGDLKRDFDGLVLPGGGDISPFFYHMENAGARKLYPTRLI